MANLVLPHLDWLFCFMRTDQAGLDAITDHEGAVLTVYADPVGIPTVGVGHKLTIGDGLKVGQKITREQSDEFLAADVAAAEDCINCAVKVALSQNQFNALVSFVFNVGCGAFRSSTLLKKLNAADYEGAANEFPRWVNAKGKRLRGLVVRREAERLLFLKE